MLVRRTSAVWAALILVLAAAGCGHQQTPRQQSSVEYAGLVSVQGFRKTEQVVNEFSEDVIMYMVGPADTDLRAAISAPSWAPGPLPTISTNQDVTYEHVIFSGTVSGSLQR